MKIVSLNAWGGAMFDSLSNWLPDCSPDVLCLQEVTCTAGLHGWTRFDDGERALPQRANLFADIRALLPEHQGMFLSSDSGPVCDNDGKRYQQDFGIAVFVRNNFPVVCSNSVFVNGCFINHNEWTVTDRPRVAHSIRVVDRERDRIVSIAHMHGLRDPAGKHDSSAREVQAAKFANLITQTRSASDFVVACGDFNLLPDSSTFTLLEKECGIVDLVGVSDTRTSRYQKPNRHANYMLVSDKDAIRSFSTPAEPEVSDHRFMVLEI